MSAVNLEYNTDPNTTLKPTILTNHVNGPTSAFWYIITLAYSGDGTIKESDNRAQIAVRYNSNGFATRYFAKGTWSPWVIYYAKPSTGIPEADLSSTVKTSLAKADNAYTKPSTGIPKNDLASAVQTSLNKADTALQSVPNATANSKGIMQVGKGLTVSNGIVSSQFVRDDSKTINNLPTDFLDNATTVTMFFTGYSNDAYTELIELVNSLLGYTLAPSENTAPYRFTMETSIGHSEEVIQKITAYSNFSTTLGAHIFTLSRVVVYSTGQWTPWKANFEFLSGSGNPNGVTYGMRSWLYQDVLTGKLYTKTTGLDAASNGGWTEVGA